MASSLAQITPYIYDDQSLNYTGTGWQHWDGLPSTSAFFNDSFTITNVSGDSFWFTFNGSNATIFGCDIPSVIASPTGLTSSSGEASSISLYVDGTFVGNQETFRASDGRIVCGETPQLSNGTHTVNATVVITDSHSYCIDYFEVTDNISGIIPGTSESTSSSTQTGTSQHRNVAARVAGGVAGGVGGIIVFAALITFYCLLSKKRHNGQSKGNEQSETDLPGTIVEKR